MSSMPEYKTKVWPYIVILGIALYIVIDILLAYLRPDYNILHNAESDYGRGPYFWVMDINFLVRCAFSLALVKALWTSLPKDRSVKKASYWLVAWAISSGLLALFADNPYGYPHLWSGSVHLVLALIAFISAMVAMFLLNTQFRTIRTWHTLATLLVAIAALASIALLLLGQSGFGPHGLGGLYERCFLGLVLAWEAIVAGKIISIKASVN